MQKPGQKIKIEYPELPVLLFVYGTLKRGFHNHHYLLGANFKTAATTVEKFPMVARGIPYLFNTPGEGTNIIGEIYEITDINMLRAMDRLEGHPDWYRRSPIKVTDGTTEMEALVYFSLDQRLMQSVKANPEMFYANVPEFTRMHAGYETSGELTARRK